MKKSLVVLLIAVLAITSVFAITGTATATAKYDIDKNSFDYGVVTKVNGAYSFELFPGYSTTTDKGYSTGYAYPYAEVEVTSTIAAGSNITAEVDFSKGTVTEYGEEVSYDKGITLVYDSTNGVYTKKTSSNNPNWNVTGFTFTLELSKFNIVGKNWTLDLINKTKLANYVKNSAKWANDAVKLEVNTVKAYYDKYYNYDFSLDDITNEGFTFTYDKLFTLGFAGNKATTASDSNYYLTVESAEQVIVEGLTGQAAVAVTKKGEDNAKFAFSAKFDYAGSKVKANAAVDFYGYKPEVAGHIEFDVVTYDVYYAKEANLYTPYVYHNTTKLTDQVKYNKTAVENYLSMKAVADWTKYAPSFTPVLTVEAFDLLNDAKELNVDFAASYLKYISAFNVGVEDALVDATWYASAKTDVCDWANVNFATKYAIEVSSKDIAAKQLTASVDWEDFVVLGFDLKLAMKDICDTDRKFTALAKYDYQDGKLVTKLGFGLQNNNVYAYDETTWNVTDEVTLAGAFGYGYDVNASTNTDLFDGAKYANASVTYTKATYNVGASFKWDGAAYSASIKAAYTAEKFTAKVQLDFAKDVAGLYYSLSSDKLVDGATLTLQYGSLTKKGAVSSYNLTGTHGAVSATCKVTF